MMELNMTQSIKKIIHNNNSNLSTPEEPSDFDLIRDYDKASKLNGIIPNNNVTDSQNERWKPHPQNILGTSALFFLCEEDKSALLKYQLNRSQPVQRTRIHCTSCDRHLGSSLRNVFNIFVHPLLHVIICKDCFRTYQLEQFDVDADGSESKCRWCSHPGRLTCCSTCTAVFCENCFRRHLSTAELQKIENDLFWKCFVCEPKQILLLKLHCYELMMYFRKETNSIPLNLNMSRTDYSKCCYHNFHVKDFELIKYENDKKKNADNGVCNKRKLIMQGAANESIKFIKINPIQVMPKNSEAYLMKQKLGEAVTSSALVNSTLATTLLNIHQQHMSSGKSTTLFGMLDATLLEATNSFENVASDLKKVWNKISQGNKHFNDQINKKFSPLSGNNLNI